MVGLFVNIECVVLRVSFLITAVAFVVMLFLSSREAAVACVVLSVVFPKTAVLSPHISCSVTVAGSVIGVRTTSVVV